VPFCLAITPDKEEQPLNKPDNLAFRNKVLLKQNTTGIHSAWPFEKLCTARAGLLLLLNPVPICDNTSSFIPL
jgi:hypothetical protein